MSIEKNSVIQKNAKNHLLWLFELSHIQQEMPSHKAKARLKILLTRAIFCFDIQSLPKHCLVKYQKLFRLKTHCRLRVLGFDCGGES